MTRWATHASRRVGLITIVLCVVAAAYGAMVQERLSAGGYEAPGGDAAAASQILAESFHAGEPNLVVLVRTPDGPDDEETAAAGQRLTEALNDHPAVSGAASYWSLGSVAPLKASDDSSALVLATIPGDEDTVNDAVRSIRDQFDGSFEGLELTLGGQGPAYLELNEQSAKDLLVVEMVITPLLLILLVIIFRGVVAALMPLMVGVLSIVGAMAVLRVLTEFTDVSVFAMNLTTALGLGLGIDYSLFVLTRYREELVRGRSVHEAIGVSLRTAGRTVVFSAATVGLSLLGLLFIPMYFLRSFAYAGVAVVLVACLATLVVLPAVLVLLGPRIDKWSFARAPIARPEDLPSGRWYRMAMWIMRRPVPVVSVLTVLLLVLGSPFLQMRLSLADARELPASAGSHQVQHELTTHYSAREMEPILAVAPDTGGTDEAASVTDYATALSRLENVARVDAVTGSFVDGVQVAPATAVSTRFAGEGATWLSIVPTVEPYGPDGQQLVEDVKAVDPPWTVHVGGNASAFHDTYSTLMDRLPWTIGTIVLSTLVLLFLLTGSVVVPIKALILNVLSLTATFGSMVWVFQEGNGSHLLGGFTITGAIVATIPVLMFCVAFGLSMDYEVFLLSRIKEEYDQSGDVEDSVARGLQRTGGLITAAATCMAVVMVAFLLSDVTFMKLLGLGLALAIVLDATVIRSMLVPALMKLMGRYNWWAPRPLRAVHERFGLTDGD